jgi:dihydrofolate reductase
MSLDGFVTGPNDDVGTGLGQGGECLHNWVFGGDWSYGDDTGRATGVDADVLGELLSSPGAMVIGRRMYDVVEGWGDEPPFGIACFVVTHRAHEPIVKGTTSISFDTDGVESAVQQAKAAAGEKDVSIGGGASIAQQCLKAGLVDEMQIHIAPVLLGDGKRLFEHLGDEHIRLERTRVLDSPFATHVKYRVLKKR